jgi:hypothetical protein
VDLFYNFETLLFVSWTELLQIKYYSFEVKAIRVASIENIHLPGIISKHDRLCCCDILELLRVETQVGWVQMQHNFAGLYERLHYF